MTVIEHLPEHHCDYCGGAFNGRAYHNVEDYDTVCAHCCVELLLTQRQRQRGAVSAALTDAAMALREAGGKLEGPDGWYAAAHFIEARARDPLGEQ